MTEQEIKAEMLDALLSVLDEDSDLTDATLDKIVSAISHAKGMKSQKEFRVAVDVEMAQEKKMHENGIVPFALYRHIIERVNPYLEDATC